MGAAAEANRGLPAKLRGSGWKEEGWLGDPQPPRRAPSSPVWVSGPWCPYGARGSPVPALPSLPGRWLHPSLPAGDSTRRGRRSPRCPGEGTVPLGSGPGAAMASLAAQDSYLQGLARRAGVQHAAESRKRKFGIGTVTLRFYPLRPVCGGLGATAVPPRGAWPGVGPFCNKKPICFNTELPKALCTLYWEPWKSMVSIRCGGGCGRAGILRKCAKMFGLFK